jgi:hypothetical protein
VARQRNEIHYGKVSTERDAVYRLGEGDIDAAVALARRQLKMYYSPRILFDLGTLQALQSERPEGGAAVFARSVAHYAEAQRVAVRAAAKYISHLKEATRHAARQRDTKACPRKTKLYRNTQALRNNSKLGFTRYPLASLARLARDGVATPEYAESYDLAAPHAEEPATSGGAVHLNSLSGASLSGPQGVISKLHKCRLHVWQTFEAPFVEWHANMWLTEDWKTNASFGIYDHSLERRFPPPGPSEYNTPRRRVQGRAISLVGFSPTNYYHWLMGALPRLVVLFPTLQASPDMKIIVPRLSPPPPPSSSASSTVNDDFISQTLRMVLPARYPLDKQRVDYNVRDQAPGLRLRVDTLVWADWTPVRTSAGRGLGPTHCLASPGSLIATQAHLQSVVRGGGGMSADGGGSDDSDSRDAAATAFVLYVGRNGTASRHLEGEWRLLERVREVLARASTAHGGRRWELVVFDGGTSGMRGARKQFDKASVVLAVHGAGLANLVFCKRHTKVIEIGFRSPAAEHYRHAALAMDMEYKWVPLESDVHAMAKKRVRLIEDGEATIVELIESAVIPEEGEL